MAPPSADDVRRMSNVRTDSDLNELHQHWLQVTEGGPGLHAEAQLLLKVATEGHLEASGESLRMVG